MKAKTIRSWNLNSANLEDSLQFYQVQFEAGVVEDEAVLTCTVPMPLDDVTTDSAPVVDFVRSGPETDAAKYRNSPPARFESEMGFRYTRAQGRRKGRPSCSSRHSPFKAQGVQRLPVFRATLKRPPPHVVPLCR